MTPTFFFGIQEEGVLVGLLPLGVQEVELRLQPFDFLQNSKVSLRTKRPDRRFQPSFLLQPTPA